DAERAPATGDRQSDLGASLGRRDRRAITRSSQHHAREATRGNRAKYLLPPTATREPGCVGASGVAAGTEKKRPSRLFGARWTNDYYSVETTHGFAHDGFSRRQPCPP